MTNKSISTIICLLLVGTILLTGCATEKSEGPTWKSDGPSSQSLFDMPSVAVGEISNPKLVLASCYESEDFAAVLQAPSYSLPLALVEIVNLEKVDSRFDLSQNQKELLRNNGFVVIPWLGDDIVGPYKTMKEWEIPIFVTSDTLLHLYHVQFDEILKRIEEEEFFDQLIDMSQGMLERAVEDYESFTEPELREAARRNVAYFAVALSLLQRPTEGYDGSESIREVSFTIPDYVKVNVSEEMENIKQHQGFQPSAIFNSPGTPNRYEEDYSQYVPRGHYTRSEVLKRFFKTMMWYGRMAFFLKGGEDALVSEEDARIATLQASLITAELSQVEAGDSTVQAIWNRIYSVTAFFVGTADDLTPYEYLDAMEKVFGTEFDINLLLEEENLLKLKAELAQMRNPEIYGGSGICVVYPPITKEKLYECLDKTKGMRFMGQRFVPDSYMFQNLVSPAVGMYVGDGQPFTMEMTQLGPARCFPRGLDVMAVLGSERAYQILEEEGDTEYEGPDTSYDKQLEELKQEFEAFDVADWNRNLYWSWLYALKPLLKDFGEGYPTFMQTQAWQDKELQTALASWAELRHDTILYAKQSYTPYLYSLPPQPKPVVGYVEPVPEFYSRMLALTRMTKDGLGQLDALSEAERSRLESLEGVLERLIQIACDELENKELDESDYEFIRNFGEELNSIVAGVEARGKATTIIADVHTDTNTMQVLEEGVGNVDLILVAYQVPDGRIIIGAGPVFSYYEFKHPISDRLTDEQWKEMLQQGEAPDRPGWMGSFYSE